MDKWRVFGGMFRVKVTDRVHDWTGAITLPLRKTRGSKARYDSGALSVRDEFWLNELGSLIKEEPLLTHYAHYQRMLQITAGTLEKTDPFSVAVTLIADLWVLHGTEAPPYTEIVAALRSGSIAIGATTVICDPMPELIPLKSSAPSKWHNGCLQARHNPAVEWSIDLLSSSKVLLPAALRSDAKQTFIPLWLAPIFFGPNLSRSDIGGSFSASLDPIQLVKAMMQVAAHGISMSVPKLSSVLHNPCDQIDSNPTGLEAAYAASLSPGVLNDMKYFRMSGTRVIEFHGRPHKRTRITRCQLPNTAAEAMRDVKAAFAWMGETLEPALLRSIVDGCRPSTEVIPSFAQGAINEENLLELAHAANTATVREFFEREAAPYTKSLYLDVNQICGIAAIVRAAGAFRCAHTGWEALRGIVDKATDKSEAQLHVFVDATIVVHFGPDADATSPSGPWSYLKSVVIKSI
jgi:hypothetical protein